eukprot:g2807.t1
MEFVVHLKDSLIKSQTIKVPVIHIHSSTGESKTRLEEIVKSLGGVVAQSADESEVTHIVYSFGPGGDPDDGVQYLRSLEMRPGEFLVHYWYYPDSYDNWMPAEVAPENLEPDHKAIGPWKVYTRWLLDSQKFNEWMNPIDYETEEFQEEQETLRFQTEEDDEIDEELLNRMDDEEEEFQSDEELESMTNDDKLQLKRKRELLEGVSGTRVKKQEMMSDRSEVDFNASQKVAPNVTKQQPLDLSKVNFDGVVKTIGDDVSLAQQSPSGDAEFKRQLYTVPLHSYWFDWNAIHEVEKTEIQCLVSTGDSMMDPEDYKSARNSIINMFRSRPSRKLKFSDVRSELVGDEVQLRLIFEFLESWGLINFISHGRGSTELDTQVTIPISAPPIVTFSNMVSFSETESAVASGSELSYGLLSKPNKFGKTVMDSGQEKGRIRCNAMPWMDCTESYYHCTTHPDIDLCPQAFQEGRLPTGTTSKDFVRINGPGVKTDQSAWTDQETLLLLEGIELYGDDWSEIAEHVCTKSQLQCAMHWLTMPIEDDIIDELLLQHQSEDEISTKVPFADAQNPIMAQVAFLAAMVSPEVAGAAAKEGLQILSQESAGTDPVPSSTTTDAGLSNGLFPGALPEHQQQVSGISQEVMSKASAGSLKSAALRAKLLAEQQEKEIKSVMMIIIDAQLKKLEMKLNYCKDLDLYLEEEKLHLLNNRQQPRSVLNQDLSTSLQSSNQQDRTGVDNGKLGAKTVDQNGH